MMTNIQTLRVTRLPIQITEEQGPSEKWQLLKYIYVMCEQHLGYIRQIRCKENK